MKHTEELLKIDTVTDTAAGNTTYLFQNDKGDAKITVHTVFPGVELIYNSVHTDRFHLGSKTEGHLIEIHHCREGRIEQQLEENSSTLCRETCLYLCVHDEQKNTDFRFATITESAF